MDRVELRELECFVAVAEELHFARAAARLGIAPPHVSRTVARLERRIGVPLFERTSRRVALTAAGETFLADSAAVLVSVDAAVRRARRSRPQLGLIVAIRPGTAVDVLAEIVELYSAPVEYLFTVNPAEAVRDGSADIAVTCASTDLDGLAVIDIDIEHPVALFAATDAIADQDVMLLNDLRADDRFVADCPLLGLDEIIVRVALGLLVVVVGESAAARCGPTVRAVPVSDMSPTVLAVVHRTSELDTTVRSFARAARKVGARRRLDASPSGELGRV